MQNLRSSKFVGRSAELDRLRALVLDRPGDEGVVLIGPAGIGKTSLANLFARTYENEFSGGAIFVSGHARPLSVSPELSKLTPNLKYLILIGDADAADQAELRSYVNLIRNQPNISLLMTARRQPTDLANLTYLELGPLSREDIWELGSDFDLDPSALDSIIRESAGSPWAVQVLLQYAREGNTQEVLKALGTRQIPTILGPDGQPLTPADKSLEKVEVTTIGLTDALIAELIAKPDLMYSFSPRRFEEFVAELYDREGYDVELTPVSKDGGVDIYAVQRTAFGSFLTLIDCKRYRKDRPVEVDLVRQLYGTVEAQDASVGVIATTSHFSRGAKAFQREREFRLGLQDFLDLQKMLRQQTNA